MGKGAVDRSMIKTVDLTGRVTKFSEIIPKLDEAAFQCMICGKVNRVEVGIGISNKPSPEECESCGSSFDLSFVSGESEFENYQEIVVNDARPVTVVLKEDLVDECSVGERVRVEGVWAYCEDLDEWFVEALQLKVIDEEWVSPKDSLEELDKDVERELRKELGCLEDVFDKVINTLDGRDDVLLIHEPNQKVVKDVKRLCDTVKNSSFVDLECSEDAFPSFGRGKMILGELSFLDGGPFVSAMGGIFGLCNLDQLPSRQRPALVSLLKLDKLEMVEAHLSPVVIESDVVFLASVRSDKLDKIPDFLQDKFKKIDMIECE